MNVMIPFATLITTQLHMVLSVAFKQLGCAEERASLNNSIKRILGGLFCFSVHFAPFYLIQ